MKTYQAWIAVALFAIASSAAAQTWEFTASDEGAPAGSTVDVTVTIDHVGTEEAWRTDIQVSDLTVFSNVDFSQCMTAFPPAFIQTCGFRAAPNDDVIRIQWSSAAAGQSWPTSADATISFTIDAGAAANTVVDLQFVAGETLVVGTFNTNDGSITVLDVTAVLNVQPPALNFVAPTGGTSAPQPVMVSNDGTDGIDLLVTSFTITGDFALEGGGSCAATPFTLADGASCTQHIEFNPQADGVVAGTFSVASDAGDVTNDTVNLSGEGLPTDAALTIDPMAFDFGDQDIDDGPVCTNITLGNTAGDDDLTIGTVTVAAPFTVTGNCNDETLGGGESCVVEACFDPAAEGAFAETLNATSDAGDVSAALTGTGTAEADISINPPFGPVSLGTGEPGDTLSADGTVTNSGSAPGDVACALDDMTGVFSTDPSPLAAMVPAGGAVGFSLFCNLPMDAVEGDTYTADLNCTVDGEPAGTHNLSCAVSTFQAIPVPTMQNWALVLFALMMLLIGGISIRFFRAS